MYFLPPGLCLSPGPGPGPQFGFTGPCPQFVSTSPDPQLVFTNPDRNVAFTGPYSGYGPKFVFTSSGQDFTTTTIATSTITTTTATNTTTTTTTTTIATTTTNDNNKRCLRGSKIHIIWPLKVFDEKVKSCFSKFGNIMANVFLIREAAFIFKQIGGCVFLKWMQIITEPIKLNKSRASWKGFCGVLSFGSFSDGSEPIRLATKKKL